jgi:hypothetical protein
VDPEIIAEKLTASRGQKQYESRSYGTSQGVQVREGYTTGTTGTTGYVKSSHGK